MSTPARGAAAPESSLPPAVETQPALAARAASLAPDFAAVFDALPGVDLLLAADAPRYTMVAATDARCAATMTTRAATLGRPLFEVFPDANPDNEDASGVGNLRASLDRVVATRAPHRMAVQRYDLQRPDGTWEERWWEPLNVPILGPDGAVTHILHRVEDVTARLRADAERDDLRAALAVERERERAERLAVLEAVFERSPAFLHVLRGPDFVFEFANAAYYTLVGRRDLLGRPAFAALPEAAAGGFPATLARVLATGEAYVGRELPVTLARTPGTPPEERLVDLVYLPLADADGTNTRVLGYGIDVTEQVAARRAAEAALAERTAVAEARRADAEAAHAAADAANRAKGEFLATMSHELRTPLNAIAGHVQLVELGVHGPLTDAQREALARVQGAQRHLLGLITDILNHAKLDAGKVAYVIETIDLRDVLAAIAPLVEPQWRAKGLAWAVDVPPGAWPVRADAEKLQQVLLNLCANAVKFTPEGGAVTLAVSRPPDTPDMVDVSVADTGVGIPADKLEAIFDPFVQVHAGRTRAHEGTGLGLTISRDLAQGMGATLRVASVEGAGATFTVRLRGAMRPPA